ncbi:cytochrome [Marivivens niveibacter]|uniref:Cytochrome n=1 Tax=Marivivens niveibacter TaxID=1930667 RepID=A0A251WUQ4_9RHOB|nr:cytochrome P450 [Marivivens niveibacter]OUD08219.1 cytochrome [Marivivens niveibacter]
MKKFQQSPTDTDFVQSPYAFYDRARAAGDIFYWDDYDLPCAVSHRAVSALLKDRRLGREAPPEKAPNIPEHLRPFYAIENHSMLELEPPRHTRLRSLVMRAFTSRRIAALEPMIETLCHDLMDQFPDGPFDLLDLYARPLPVIVICHLLGVPASYADQLLAWSNDMVAIYQARRTKDIELAAAKAAQEFADFIRSFIDEKRLAPADDLISELIRAEEEGEKLSTDELITTVILLLNAGHEATVHTLGNGVYTLLQNGYPPITPATVEEVIRFDPPLHMFTRWVYEDVELFGHPFKRGDQIGCLLAAANRDPLAYEDPDQFKPDRSGPKNTSFGGGIHFCVGAPLARLELLIALRTLQQRFPNLRLDGQPQYADVFHFHGLEQLTVKKA